MRIAAAGSRVIDEGLARLRRELEIPDRCARMQLCDVAVVARVAADDVQPGDALRVELVEADPERRIVRFVRAGGAGTRGERGPSS